VEDRPGGRVDVMPTSGASPRLTPLRGFVALERAVLVALRTMGRLPVRRVPSAPQPLQASVVVGELAHELHEGERRFGRSSASRLEAVNWGHLTLLVGKKARWAATRRAFAFGLSKPNISGSVGQHWGYSARNCQGCGPPWSARSSSAPQPGQVANWRSSSNLSPKELGPVAPLGCASTPHFGQASVGVSIALNSNPAISTEKGHFPP
jgi:hypothetical protein